MVTYTVYKTATGEVIKTSTRPYYEDDIGEGLSRVDGVFGWDKYYIASGVPTLRPTIQAMPDKTTILAAGVDICTITGIPAGAEVTSNDTTITADGNPLEFVTDIPGEHRLSITLWPYQDAEVTINAI